MLPEGSLNVLDVGCGTGEISFVLMEMGHSVTGIDLSESMLEIAREKSRRLGKNARFMSGDAEDLKVNYPALKGVACTEALSLGYNRLVDTGLQDPSSLEEDCLRLAVFYDSRR